MWRRCRPCVALALTYRCPIFQSVWCAPYKFSMLQHANRFVQQSQPVTFINDIRQDAGSRSLSVQMFQALDIVCHTLALCPLFDTCLVTISCMRFANAFSGEMFCCSVMHTSQFWLLRLMNSLSLWLRRESQSLTLIPLTWRIRWAPNNASNWQMGFNSAFKGLTLKFLRSAHTVYLCVLCGSQNKQRLFPYTTLTDCFL